MKEQMTSYCDRMGDVVGPQVWVLRSFYKRAQLCIAVTPDSLMNEKRISLIMTL